MVALEYCSARESLPCESAESEVRAAKAIKDGSVLEALFFTVASTSHSFEDPMKSSTCELYEEIARLRAGISSDCEITHD